MKRREGDRAGGINIEDLMLNCRQKVVVGSLKGQNIRTLNAGVGVVDMQQ